MARLAATEYDKRRVKYNCRCALLVLVVVFAGGTVSADDDRENLIAAALQVSPEYTQPIVRSNGEPVAIYHELNGDGKTDVAVMAVLKEPGVPQTLDSLRQNSRLFRRGNPHPLFVLETYFAGDDAVQTVELGRWPAFDRMELVNLVPDAAFPVAVGVRTRGATGNEYNLIVYSNGGMIRRVRLEQSDRQRYEIGDLDGDGSLDIVRTLRTAEAGRGYETFVEFLSLSGGSYVVAGSFALVRELRLFLNTAAAHMLAGRWEELAGMVKGSEESVAGLLRAAFEGVADDEEMGSSTFEYPASGEEIAQVVFPGLMENPLPYPFLGETFTIIFRVECCDLLPRFFSATVELREFPFEGEMFRFLTYRGARQ